MRGFEDRLRKRDVSIKEAIKFYIDTEALKWRPLTKQVAEIALNRYFTDQAAPLNSLFRRVRGEGLKETTQAAHLYHELTKSKSLIEGQNRTISAATHRSYLKRARSFTKWCTEQGLLPSDPLVGLKAVGRPNAGKAQMTRDEAKRWTNTALQLIDAGDAAALAALLALLLGVRQSEVTLRKVGDVDNVAGPGAMVLRIPFAKTQKGVRDREVPALVDAALRRHIQGRPVKEWLFPWTDHRGHTRHHEREWLTLNVRRICRLAGVNEVCAHSLRGLHSTLAIKRGMSPNLVADELGHESFATTRKHYLAPGTLEAVSQGAVTSFLDPSAQAQQKLLEQLAKHGLGMDGSGNIIDKQGLRGSERGRKVRNAAKRRRRER